MLTVQYKGKGERTIGTQVVYPGELLHATPNLLAAWQAEHGDVFVVVQGDVPPAQPTASEPEEAETPVEPKAKRK
jgi:hypothetical protein